MKNDLDADAATRPDDSDLDARLALLRAQTEHRQRRRDRLRKERRILIPCLSLAALTYFSLGTARVDGHSMEPTLHTGDTLYVWKSYHYFTKVKPGDLLVIHLRHGDIKGEEIVKRVVFVQNAAGNAAWPKQVRTTAGMVDARQYFLPYVIGRWPVPPGAVMVMGDNTENSMDSRDFGPVRPYEIEGKVLNH